MEFEAPGQNLASTVEKQNSLILTSSYLRSLTITNIYKCGGKGMSFFIKNALFVILYIFLSHNLAFSDGTRCVQCHQEVYDEISRYPFPHSGFVQNNCEGCHIKGKVVTSTSRNKGFWGGRIWGRKLIKTVSKDNFSKKPIEKFQGKVVKSPGFSLENIVVLNNLVGDSAYKIRISLTDRFGMKSQSDILSFVPNTITEFLVDDLTPSVIRGLETSRIESSVFSTAEIVWSTEKLTDSMIEYGLTKDYEASSHSGLYSRKHKIVLNGLNNNAIYYYRVISTDFFGNKSISADYSFDTSKSLNQPLKTSIKNIGIKPIFKMIKILRLKTAKNDKKGIRVGVLYSSSNEVKSSVEYMKEKSADLSDIEVINHGKWGLKGWRETSLASCKNCHIQGPASHPVGVSSSASVRINENLPTGEGGVITCVTCHTPHGGKLKFLARVDFKRDMCIMCHLKEF